MFAVTENTILPSVTSEPDETPVRSCRTVPLLLIGLAGLLLCAVFLSVLALTRIQNNYTAVVMRTAEQLDRVHSITYNASVLYANTVALSFAADDAERAELRSVIAARRGANDRIFERLRVSNLDTETRALLNDVLATRAVYQQSSAPFLETAPGQPAVRHRSPKMQQLVASFTAYQTACDKLSDRVQITSSFWSAEAADEAARFKNILWALGLLPIALAAVVAFLAIYLITTTPTEMDLE